MGISNIHRDKNLIALRFKCQIYARRLRQRLKGVSKTVLLRRF